MPDLLVVVQGLLNSKGSGPNPTPAGFDAVNYVIKNIENSLKLGYKVIFLCWNHENRISQDIILTHFENNINFKTQQVVDSYGKDGKFKMLSSLYDQILIDNKIKSETYILKIRSDMLMPDTFWEWIKEINTREVISNNKIYVSELNEITGYLGDFILLGTKKKLEQELAKYVAKSSLVLHPGHSDIGLKLIANESGSFKIITRKATRKKWINYIHDNVEVIPKDIFADTIWRGKRVSEVIDIELFTSPSDYKNFSYRSNDFKSLLYAYNINGLRSSYIMNSISFLQFILKSFVAFKRKVKNYSPINRKKIYSRSACFGRIVVEDRNIIGNGRIENFQKARIDYVNQVLNRSKTVYESYDEISKVITNPELQDFQKQNIALNEYEFKNVDIYIIDTFSDLTDKKFGIKGSNSYFYSHYNDLNKDSEIFSLIEDHGLLDIHQVKIEYQNFIDKIMLMNNNSIMIFIHYPSKFESRIEYIQRGEKIFEILSSISNSYKNVYNVKLSDSQVIAKDSFPYHFSTETNQILQYEIARLVKR